jgi:hypothetical protein
MTTWRLELWSTLEAAGGIRLAPIAFPRDVRERRTTDGEHTLSFALPWHHPAERPIGSEVEVNFRLGQVVRFVKGPDDWTEHRIGNVTARRSSRGKERLIVANGVLQELAVRGLVFRSQAGGHTPASFEVLGLTVPEHLDTYILPALESARQFFWSRGAVEYLTPVDVTYDRDTPLSALRKLQAAAGGLELDITRIATGYALNLVRQIGAGDRAGHPHLRLRGGLRRPPGHHRGRRVEHRRLVLRRGAADRDGLHPRGPGRRAGADPV